MSPYHREALDHLVYGIKERKGFVVITGGVGTGKTTLCRALLSRLEESTKTALIFNAFISEMELLKAVNQEFSIDGDPEGASKKDYVDALNRFLLENFSRGGNAVLLIDEAQNLSHGVLEQIRMLSNLETEREKLLQIVLVGQSELRDLLGSPALKQLDERVTVRYELRPLRFGDVERYVSHRLVVAGGMGNLRFTRGAFKKIYAHSKGNPRRINAICDRALLIAYAEEKHALSKGMVSRAIQELQGGVPAERLGAGWSWARFFSFTVLLLFLIMVAGLAGWSSRERISAILLRGQGPAVTQEATKKVVQSVVPTEKAAPKEAPLFLGEEVSLAWLFGLFHKMSEDGSLGAKAGLPMSLVTFHVEPDDYIMFKKPFRVMTAGTVQPSSGQGQYLLIREVTQEGAVAIDGEGKERKVPKAFVLDHWGKKVSCVYPFDGKSVTLHKGMLSPEVSDVQRILGESGYPVAPTGVYDDATVEAVVKFQRDFGLADDGIAGPKTMSLLYQMTK